MASRKPSWTPTIEEAEAFPMRQSLSVNAKDSITHLNAWGEETDLTHDILNSLADKGTLPFTVHESVNSLHDAAVALLSAASYIAQTQWLIGALTRRVINELRDIPEWFEAEGRTLKPETHPLVEPNPILAFDIASFTVRTKIGDAFLHEDSRLQSGPIAPSGGLGEVELPVPGGRWKMEAVEKEFGEKFSGSLTTFQEWGAGIKSYTRLHISWSTRLGDEEVMGSGWKQEWLKLREQGYSDEDINREQDLWVEKFRKQAYKIGYRFEEALLNTIRSILTEAGLEDSAVTSQSPPGRGLLRGKGSYREKTGFFAKIPNTKKWATLVGEFEVRL